MKRFVEIVWLIIAIVSAITAIHAYLNSINIKDTIVFSALFFISSFMFFFRKKQRKQNNKNS